MIIILWAIFFLCIFVAVSVKGTKSKPKLKKNNKVTKTYFEGPLFCSGSLIEKIYKQLNNTLTFLPADYYNYLLLKKNGFSNYPIYKIYPKSIKELRKYLMAVEQVDKFKCCNLVICYKTEKLFPNEVKFEISKIHFSGSKVFCYREGSIPSKLMFAINTFNCNINFEEYKNVKQGFNIPFLKEVYKEGYLYSTANKKDVQYNYFRTYNYQDSCQVEKVNIINKSSTNKRIKLEYAIVPNLYGYFSTKYDKWLKILDFCANSTMQICSNNRYKILHKGKGLVFQFSILVPANSSQQLYIYRAEKDFVITQEYFNKTLNLLKQSRRISVFSENTTLNNLINYELPNQIVFELINFPDKRNEILEFFNYWKEKDVYIPNPLWSYKGNFVDFYFALLKRYFGVVLKEKGIILKPSLLGNCQVFVCSPEGQVVLNVQNNGQKMICIDNVEYSNFNCLSYKTLANKDIKVCI